MLTYVRNKPGPVGRTAQMAPRETPAPAPLPAPVVQLGADLSPAVAALESAYRMIQRRYPETPNATIVVKRDAKAWGHTTVAKVWSPAKSASPDRLEIMISGENLARGARSVAATLLHEAAHARNLAKGVVDTDTNGRHNAKFKATAEEMGLEVASRGWLGFTDTTLTEESAGGWKRMVDTIARGLDKSAQAHRPAPVLVPAGGAKGKGGTAAGTLVAPPKRGNRNLIKAVCGCGYSIRASQGVLDKAEPRCDSCGTHFLPVS